MALSQSTAAGHGHFKGTNVVRDPASADRWQAADSEVQPDMRSFVAPSLLLDTCCVYTMKHDATEQQR
jgi:hypothetical protein